MYRRGWLALGRVSLLFVLTHRCDGFSARRRRREAEQIGIAFTMHHKTGTYLGLELERCCVENGETHNSFRRCLGNVSSEVFWKGVVPHDCSRIVHFVRSPIEIALSSYLYHRQQPPPESWLARPVESCQANPWKECIPKEAVPDNHPSITGETYNEYLNRVPMSAGVHMDMMATSFPILKEMEKAYLVSQSDPRVLTMCLEDSWADFEGMATRIATFLDLPFSEGFRSCSELHDPSKHTFGTHTTSGSLTRGEENKLRDMIHFHDQKWFNGRFNASPLAAICGKPKDKAGGSHSQEDEWMEEYA